MRDEPATRWVFRKILHDVKKLILWGNSALLVGFAKNLVIARLVFLLVELNRISFMSLF